MLDGCVSDDMMIAIKAMIHVCQFSQKHLYLKLKIKFVLVMM